VNLRRPAVALLKVTFHPRWHVTVDGAPARVEMMSPSLMGVDVPAGRHDVVFTYEPYPSYPLLIGLGFLVVLVAAGVPRILRRRTATVDQLGV
jgi:hypothetical protein